MIYLGPEVKIGFRTEGRGAGTLEPRKRDVGSLPGPGRLVTDSELLSGCPWGAWSSSDSTTTGVGEGISLRLRKGL